MNKTEVARLNKRRGWKLAIQDKTGFGMLQQVWCSSTRREDGYYPGTQYDFVDDKVVAERSCLVGDVFW